MDPSVLSIVVILGIGLLTGVTTGLTGSSGVAVVVPLLSIILGFDVHEAIATSLVIDVIASVVIAYTYYRHGHLRLGSGIWIALGSIVGAQLGARFAGLIPDTGLGTGFGIFMAVAGLIMWVKRGKGLVSALNADNGLALGGPAREAAVAVGLGLLIGIGTGITGAGGGLMVLLVLVFVLSFSIHDAVGTSTLIMALTATSGAAGYAVQGDANLIGGVVAGAGAAIGGLSSAVFANQMSERRLNSIISVLFMVLGVAMVIVYFTTDGVSLIEGDVGRVPGIDLYVSALLHGE